MKSMHRFLPFWFLLLQIMERALLHMDNSYKIPNVRGTGRLCKTNLPSNTAFRGFGGPQALFIAEHWMSDVAVTCGLPAEEVSGESGGTGQRRLACFVSWTSPVGVEDGQALVRGRKLNFQLCPPGLLPPTWPQCLSPWEGTEEEPVQRRGPDTLQPEA